MTSSTRTDQLRLALRQAYLAKESISIRQLAETADLSLQDRQAIADEAAGLVRQVRGGSTPTLMENFLAEYGLSTREGVALMCLAEALLRVPDFETIEALIEDKISPADWSRHLGQSSSPLVNASTWALMLTGRVLARNEDEGLINTLQGVIRQLGEPVVRTAVGEAMKELGRQFVLGRSIEEASKRGAQMESQGYTYSYDMLGEAARTEADARTYHLSYSKAIAALAPQCTDPNIRHNPGISVKLSALHPRYEFAKQERVMKELTSRTLSLALLAKSAGMGFNIDAEEADRLDLSLDVIEAVLSDDSLAGWDGFGVVVQAYGPRAPYVLDWLYDLTQRLDRRIMIRLVKGAYWDTEIKRAHVLGLDGFPVFTRKVNSDIAYIACARKLFDMTDRIYPQFATHNAHTVASVLHMAKGERESFEFQRLHGMGEALHDAVLKQHGAHCRIYAPVGAHQDLLAYLVRRLLENGSNSSFVNRIVDENVTPEEIARDPFLALETQDATNANPNIPKPAEIYGEERVNARGWDLTEPLTVGTLAHAMTAFRNRSWQAGPMIETPSGSSQNRNITNPAHPEEIVGQVCEATPEDVENALASATQAYEEWSAKPARERADCLRRVADLYEDNAAEFFALATREAGKTLADGVAEIREAVDFLRYYAKEAEKLEAQEAGHACGVIVCISPWNFPLAIFTGQIAAALATGNAVIAKPAEQTPLIAARAIEMMRESGIPKAIIQLLPGDGPTVGAPLVSDPRVSGVCFTGSTETAQLINRTMAENLSPDAPLIAETGGLNAMIVDSTALPEQAIVDILASSFQSAGQRCSALRILYVQKDIEEKVLEMLSGAMDELSLGDPWNLSTDVGPVIDDEARASIESYIKAAEQDGRLLKRLQAPETGIFVAPAVLRVSGIADLEREIFGPVLHVATFEADQLDTIMDDINAQGYGLTFGLHTRVDKRVQKIIDMAHVGNLYVNRNQIGAVVGSQPFGGEGLSGTGPKAGGPHYLHRFLKADMPELAAPQQPGNPIDTTELLAAISRLSIDKWSKQDNRGDRLAKALSEQGLNPDIERALKAADRINMDPCDLPGPTGESNRLSLHARGIILCLGPTEKQALSQAVQALTLGNAVLIACPGGEQLAKQLQLSGAPVIGMSGIVEASFLESVSGIAAVASMTDKTALKEQRCALARRAGEIIPLISEDIAPLRYIHERSLCIDTTAAGGNASLLATADT